MGEDRRADRTLPTWRASVSLAVLGHHHRRRLNDAAPAQHQTTLVPIDDAGVGVSLEAGSVDAYAGDKVKLIGAVAAGAREPARMALVLEDLSYRPYALALPRNDSALRLEVNRALTRSP